VKNLNKVRLSKNFSITLLASVLIHTALACGDAIVGRRYESDSSSGGSTEKAGAGGVTEPPPTQITGASGGHPSTFTVSYTAPEGGAGGLGGSYSTPPNTVLGTAGTKTSSQYCVIGVVVNATSIICDPAPAIGDVDCNGVVNAVDALRVGRRAENLETPPFFEPAGDINCDGCLTTDDATLISNIDVGNLVPTPCP
jgi:hypothetical protein